MNLQSTGPDVSLVVETRVDPDAARHLSRLLFGSIDLTELDGAATTSTQSHMMNPKTGMAEGMST